MSNQHLRKFRLSSQRCTRHHAGPRRGFLHVRSSNQAYESLERAVQTLNKVISVGSGKNGALREGVRSPNAKRRTKSVPFMASLKVEKMVQEFPTASKSVQSYLALPIEQYSLLDPKLVAKDDKGRFHVNLPLYDLVGIDLTPGVFVKVDVDAESAQVTFTAEEFTSGEPKLDQLFSIGMVAVLSSSQGAHRIDVARAPADGASPAAPSIVRQLACMVDVNMSLEVPHPLSIAPRPMLSSIGAWCKHRQMLQLCPARPSERAAALSPSQVIHGSALPVVISLSFCFRRMGLWQAARLSTWHLHHPHWLSTSAPRCF
jgi:hypothetical protein